MSVLGGGNRTGGGGADPGARPHQVEIEERRATRAGVVCAGTLACAHCDVPVGAGPHPLALTDTLICPYCHRRGPVRDFLSLSSPSRPARVVVRARLRL